MNKEDLRIVFMGTPGFAVASLKALIENKYNVVGVITAPDRPAGRGYKLQPSAVKEYALSQGLNILQPEKLRDESFLEELKALKADIQVVVAFRMLPEVVWNMPPMGTFNLHGSLLPQYRGAAPINWAIINGEKKTGVTTFFLKHEIDTGKIILQESIDIEPNDNVEVIHDKLMLIGATLVTKTIVAILNDEIEAKPQNNFFKSESDLKPAPKIFKETCEIDWSKSSAEIHNFVRGLSPYPAAWTNLKVNDEVLTFKVFETNPIVEHHDMLPGSIITDNKATLRIATQDGFVELLDIQLSGKRRMKTSQFLNGFSFS